jgi:hypothetical protein
MGVACDVAGDVMATGTVAEAGNVAGNVLNSVKAQSFPAPDSTALRGDAGLLNLLGNLGVVLTFLVSLLNGHYDLHFNSTANQIGGQLSGKGTLVFDSDIKVKNDVTYANRASRAVIIVLGDLDVDKTVTQMDGIWYVTGNFRAKGTSATLRNTRGSIIVGAASGNEFQRPLDIVMDSDIFNNRAEGFKHCLPGFWPTADAGVLR